MAHGKLGNIKNDCFLDVFVILYRHHLLYFKSITKEMSFEILIGLCVQGP